MRLVLIAAVVLFITAAPAAAETTIVDRPNLQTWVDQSKVPTPDLELEVVRTANIGEYGCPPEGADGCANISQNRIVIAVGQGRPTFYHELGHFFDYKVMTDLDRQWIARQIFNRSETRWILTDALGLQEYFAKAYALCATGRFDRTFWERYGIRGNVQSLALTGQRIDRVCRKVRQIALRAAGA